MAVCLPATDHGLRERVRRVVDQDRWDLDSPEGLALMQAVLRGSYPLATVLSHGVTAGGRHRAVVLDIYRDGHPGDDALGMRWVEAVFDQSSASAYRVAARILGDGSAAEWVVEQAFRDLRRAVPGGWSLEAGAAAIEAAVGRLANAARATEPAPETDNISTDVVAKPALAETSLRKGGVRRVLSSRSLAMLLSSQREALELSLLEDLKVKSIADRMQTTPAVVHRHLTDALLAVASGTPPSVGTTLSRWRQAQREWAKLPAHHRARPEQRLSAAHAWLDYQVASKAVSPETIVLVTDTDRRFVATSARAAHTFGRPSLVGLHIDDVTAAYARPLVPELWTLFDANGSMSGEYDCDRPGQDPVRTQFRGVWGRPLPDLQVGYLDPPVAVATEAMAPP